MAISDVYTAQVRGLVVTALTSAVPLHSVVAATTIRGWVVGVRTYHHHRRRPPTTSYSSCAGR